MSKEDFIIKARTVHGDKYDYSKVVYINNTTKVCIICHEKDEFGVEHGEFWQTPKNHLKGCGCPKCSKTYRMSTEDFIKKAISIHGNKYDYSKTIYKNYQTKVCIICPIHGEFYQLPGNHLKGEGCIKCRNDKMSVERSSDSEKFIMQAKQIHGNKYVYSKVDYKNNHEKVCIICPEHGEFWQMPCNHLHGAGCPWCYKAKKTKKVENKKAKIKKDWRHSFLNKSIEKYGDKYDYSKVNYINSTTKVCIVCPKHGEFWKTPNKFLSGQECPECHKEAGFEKIKNKTPEFIDKANKVHRNKYDYSNVEYTGLKNKIKIICHCKDKNGKEHGVFEQNANSHIQGCGCPLCAQEARIEKSIKTNEQFISEAKEKFPEYDYSKTKYYGRGIPVTIICHNKYKNGKEHGEFSVIPAKMLDRGTHCPHCTKQTSYPEKEIYSYIVDKIGIENVKFHDRKILNGDEIDIYIPSKKVGIEFNGIYWHSEYNRRVNKNSHINKTEKCEREGIHLIQIFSDEYSEKRNVIFKKINELLGITEKKCILLSPQCEIKEIKQKEAKDFFNEYCINGYTKSSFYIAAYYKEKIIAAMSFIKARNGEYILNRFAVDDEYKCVNIYNNLFNYFVQKNKPAKVKAFLDRRYYKVNENIFNSIGFKFDGYIDPDYTYMYAKKSSLGRFNKNFLKNKNMVEKYNLSSVRVTNKIANGLGYFRVWDCGQIKFIWNK